jgi:hypothetical protein
MSVPQPPELLVTCGFRGEKRHVARLPATGLYKAALAGDPPPNASRSSPRSNATIRHNGHSRVEASEVNTSRARFKGLLYTVTTIFPA